MRLRNEWNQNSVPSRSSLITRLFPLNFDRYLPKRYWLFNLLYDDENDLLGINEQQIAIIYFPDEVMK